MDAYLLKFKSPEIALEIKWKEKITLADVQKAEDTLGKIDARRKILFVPDKAGMRSNRIEIMDVSDL